MAFNTLNWVRSAGYGYDGATVPVDFKYNGTADTKATILAADYFLEVYEQLSVGSFLQFTASDATLTLCMVTASSSSTVTISEITETLPPGSVDTADLADGCVTNPKLALLAVDTNNIALLAVTNEQMAAGAALANLAAGSITAAKMATGVLPIANVLHTTTATATQTVTVADALVGDVVQVTINTAGTTPPGPILSAIAGAGSITITTTATPGTDSVLNVSVFRG